MGFKRLVPLILTQTIFFVCGLLGSYAYRHQLYATTLLSLLVALALFGLSFGTLRRPTVRLASPGPSGEFARELGRQRLVALLDQAPSPLFLRNEDDSVIAVNRAARQLFRSPVAASQALLKPAGSGSLPQGQIEWEGRRYAMTRSDLDGPGWHCQLIALADISGDVRAAEAGALRDILTVLNHELMNALTPVASLSRTALEIIEDPPPDALNRVSDALKRVVSRTEGLIDFVDAYRVLSRLPAPDIRAVALMPWLEDVVQSFAMQWTAKDVALEAPPLPQAVTVLMDPHQMRLCLANLLNNAAEAALEQPPARVRLTLTMAPDRIDLIIEDSGAGISPGTEEDIFRPFFTTKQQGSGIGLSLARQIVRGHGGDITLLDRTSTNLSGLGGAAFQIILNRAVGAGQ